jgi:hypothetical protein
MRYYTCTGGYLPSVETPPSVIGHTPVGGRGHARSGAAMDSRARFADRRAVPKPGTPDCVWACPRPDNSHIGLLGVSAGGDSPSVQWKVRSERWGPVMAVAVTSFDNPEVMQVPQASGQTLFFCSGVALVNYTGTGENWRKDDLVFTVPSEQPGIGNPPPLPIPNFADSVVTVVPATIQNNNADEEAGWGIDNADSVIDGNNNIQVTARIVVKEESATVLRVAYHAVILG